jgi:Tfp pilus assembly PilM family ATPase
MPNKLAIDWDETELRLVAAQCSGSSVKVTDAAVIPVENSNIVETLRAAIQRRGLENTETLVAIGRGKAELRELQLPPVPDEELPDMVRFQAIRSFASAGDSATVDYLVTHRSESGVELIAAAVGPASLTEIRETCEAAELLNKRISLRPLAASALYLIKRQSDARGDTVLIDLLANDAEIVVAREGRVIFVRTVRMPTVEAARAKALAGELRRSLVACGSTGSLDRVVLWGREAVHADDMVMLAKASGTRVEILDPFELVEVDRKAKADLPDHVGRLAPLVGLLAADEGAPDRLVDFLNPRQRAQEAPNHLRTGLMIGVPVAAALLLGYLMFSHLKGLDQQIADLKSANESLKPQVDAAVKSIARTESIDKFLDGDVNWLSELRRLAKTMPPSDQMIVRHISATSDPRGGGGTLKVIGAVTTPGVIDEFEESLRDEAHRVVGDGASVQKNAKDAYRWDFTESITVTPDSIRNGRYAAMNELLLAEKETPATESAPPVVPAEPIQSAETPIAESPPDDSPPDQPAAVAEEGEGDGSEATQPATESVGPAPAELAAQAEVQS